jgi:acetolactate synthase-1/2/3 large subunit
MKNPDWVKFAQSMGCVGLRCNKPEDLPGAIKAFLEAKGPVILDAVCDDAEHVYPMVPAGKALDEMVLHPAVNNIK